MPQKGKRGTSHQILLTFVQIIKEVSFPAYLQGLSSCSAQTSFNMFLSFLLPARVNF